MGGNEFADLHVLRVGADICDPGGEGCIAQRNELLRRQQFQSASFVRGIVWNGDDGTVAQIREMLDLLRVDSHRQEDRFPDRRDLVSAVLYLVVEIGLVLKRVGLEITGVESLIGNGVIADLDDFDLKPVLRSESCNLVDNFDDQHDDRRDHDRGIETLVPVLDAERAQAAGADCTGDRRVSDE